MPKKIFPPPQPLAVLPRLLRDSGYALAREFRYLRDEATNAAFPCFQVNGHWYFSEAKLPAIIDSLRQRRLLEAIH